MSCLFGRRMPFRSFLVLAPLVELEAKEGYSFYRLKHMHYVYILRLSNGTYYSGSTRNLRERLRKHRKGDIPSTAKYRPHELAWCGFFADKEKAILFEKYLKTASGKAFRNKRLV